MTIKIGIAEDQLLFLKSLGALVNSFENFETIIEALNGEELIKKLSALKDKPQIILLDINMPVLDGIETARQLTKSNPEIRLVALSMKDDDLTIIKMLKAGCCAYLLKDVHPLELEKALKQVAETGFYNADVFNLNSRNLLKKSFEEEKTLLSAKEELFLKLACSDLTYKQIASKMFMAERTIDGYRESLFQKFNVQSRVGMVLEGLRRGLLSIEKQTSGNLE